MAKNTLTQFIRENSHFSATEIARITGHRRLTVAKRADELGITLADDDVKAGPDEILSIEDVAVRFLKGMTPEQRRVFESWKKRLLKRV